MERTLVMIKPDGVQRNLIGKVISIFEEKGLRVVALKKVKLSKEQAKQFYVVHKERPFFESLTDYMSSGPVVAMVLEGEQAIKRVREIMGATDPKEAQEGTIRKLFAIDKEKNTVHGSDSPESAAKEIPFFFSEYELLSAE
ncbi:MULTISPECIES: nucleoside-diphosphate kinase [Thermodesulfobacterium]|uniref:Nucleoside diphosphate kinase n=2 Tax=Thermodesulfobacterium commune TaxID=1741 RepID=A0A075WSC2_9BACT|nr:MULTISPECIES: nucleoside-diphosphate kinase [Thermodesulfobacterium]AIH03925.1 nucleoside diphosphate kinase [Thermodesulfobacterium commune DSM 2178]HAA83244.1 nucleoside-diphosphate kinase [Thermodesulfobacterium commune]HBT03223.1 nucleoside-diphosphate kinase [Thermodesulfobacterium commune]HCP09491.1 nucleoside-diphosphate kinase [Thermodesulfobacterium commune]